MAYTINPQAPKVCRDAVVFANKHGVSTAARRYGVSPGTISKWQKKARVIGLHPIPIRICWKPIQKTREYAKTY